MQRETYLLLKEHYETCQKHHITYIISQMVKGYILIKMVPGLESSALPQIRSIPGVLEVNMVFGSWDTIAITEAKTLAGLSTLIIGQIRGVQGVQDTATLVQGDW